MKSLSQFFEPFQKRNDSVLPKYSFQEQNKNPFIQQQKKDSAFPKYSQLQKIERPIPLCPSQQQKKEYSNPMYSFQKQINEHSNLMHSFQKKKENLTPMHAKHEKKKNFDPTLSLGNQHLNIPYPFQYQENKDFTKYERSIQAAKTQHHALISKVKNDIDRTKKNMMYVRTLDELQNIQKQKEALELQLKELNDQMNEFETFIKEIKYSKQSQAECEKRIERELKKIQLHLPIYAQRSKIIQTIRNNRVTVIIGVCCPLEIILNCL